MSSAFVTVPLIVMPPLGMATGFGMFFYPPFRIPVLWVVGAVLFGAVVLAEPLRRTSRLERRADGGIVLKRSKAFLWILLGLLALRIGLHEWVGRYVSATQTAARANVTRDGLPMRTSRSATPSRG